ncbi:hypothetical protein [Burkholderia lata]|uniref:hypothetical protein n=1 Tax=Burkholderia lata (strain ATCC 17760 / DSM 23089 / LMG 22485 / NCIMB 9086 / R18194 / 383) TaxID=482957 RepID=UPI00158371E8|nr:hypothetical protein [Burkholderia lata]
MQKTELMRRILELGIVNVREEQISLGHFRLTVDDAHVDIVQRLVYECVPAIFRVDVVGMNEPRLISISRDDLLKFKEHFDNQVPCEVDSRLWLVQGIEFETGPTWRGRVNLVPFRPINHEWGHSSESETTASPDSSKPQQNHVRDAVEANR